MCVVTTRALVDWYRTCARDLPWRSEPRDPYLVLVSEIMLQQTQVDRVAPRFASFVERFPTFADLAAATEDEVLTAWSGLGYYRRGRNLHRLAREVAAGAGCLPRTASDLERLPGIGPYTAAAVASLAFGEAVPVLDGNVMRVGARVLAMETDPRSAAGRRRLETWIVGLMEGAPPGQVNEALMELGAVVCRPVEPDCAVCPFANRCGAKAEGRPEAYPPPRRRRAQVALRWVAACCVDREGAWLLRRIDEGPILRGLWLPPLAELEDRADPVDQARRLLPDAKSRFLTAGPAIRHHITHRKIDVVPVRIEVGCFDPPSESWRWVDPRDPGVPTSSLLEKLVENLPDFREVPG
jgi:A/G-specific adenine glycosylase